MVFSEGFYPKVYFARYSGGWDHALLHDISRWDGGLGKDYLSRNHETYEVSLPAAVLQSRRRNGHPMSPTWPPQMLTTIEFEAVGNKTKIVLTWKPVDASKEEM